MGIYPKEALPYHRGMCYTMLIVALSVIDRRWKQPKCPTSIEWIQKMWFIYKMGYYSAFNKEDMSFAVKWMELENILGEVTKSQKDMHGMYICTH